MAAATVLASAARTASGDRTLPGYGDKTRLRAQLDVTAFAGTTPTLDVVVEDSLDGATWNTLFAFAQRTGVGREVKDFVGVFADEVRVRYTIAGAGASFTFAVHLHAD